MSALSVEVPFPVFYDRSGEPLENGYVWIGQANLNPQTNPIQVYWDRNLTQPAAQPLRTLAGYVSNAGTPAQVYVDATNFSILVQDKSGTMVYSVPEGAKVTDASNVSLTGFKGQVGTVEDLADDDGSDWIGFEPFGSGAVARSAQDKMREAVSVKDFGAVGDGVANDAAAIRAAFAASDSVLFPSGTYWCGQIDSGNTFFDLTDKGAGVAILTQGFVELVGETTSVSECQFFRLLPGPNGSQSHFYCDPIRFRDLGYVSGFPAKGLTGFRIENNNNNWGNLRFIGIYGSNIASAIVVTNRDNIAIANNRIRGIFIDEIFVDNANYGIVLAGQGDGVYIKKLVTFQVFRSFFAYNVSEADVSIFARSQKSTSGAVNLGWFTEVTNGPPLQGIKVRYYSRDTSTPLNHVLINVIGPNLGQIRGIDLNLDIADNITGNTAVQFIAYTQSGGVPDPTALANVMTDIIIRGRVGSQTNTIDSLANFTSPQSMTLLSTNIPVAANAYNNFRFTTVRTYSPTWTASLGNPSLGNGTLTGEYFVVNGMCQVTVTMLAGSTTTFGSGPWSFSLPITCRSINAQRGSALALDAGTLYYVGTADAAGTGLQATFDQTNTQAQSTVPFTWASGDSLTMTVSYPI